MAPNSLLEQLHQLNRSSSRFHDQLSNILYGEEFEQHVANLDSDGLLPLVDYLDMALDTLDPASSAFRKCLRELRTVCGNRTILPTSHLNGTKVCVKRVKIYSKDGPEKAIKTLCQEVVVWKHLLHPNIVPLLGITPIPLQLISEWIPGGDLTEYVKKHPGADRLGLLSDVANGLYYLHFCNVVHGDLKGPNILVDATGCARITDFGLAPVTQNLDSMRSASDDKGHTARWTAPEILNERGTYSKEADIFSFAMVIIEVFTGSIPFNNCLPAAAVLAIINGTRPSRPAHLDFTDELWRLAQRCWDQNPHSRPEVSEVLRVLGGSDPPVINPRIRRPSTATPTIGKPLPSAPANLFARGDIVTRSLDQLNNFVSLVLSGAVGIGKTSIALTLLHHNHIRARFGHRRYFMHCDDLANSLKYFLQRLSDAIGLPPIETMELLRPHLTRSRPLILVLDGLECILDPLAVDSREIASAIEEITQYHNICLVATSRMTISTPGFQSIEVPALPESGARDVFYSLCSLNRSTAIDDLIESLDSHPLSVTLLAGAACEKNWDEPMLLHEWGDAQTGALRLDDNQTGVPRLDDDQTGTPRLDDNRTYTFRRDDHRSLAAAIESALAAPTIQQLGPAAQETLETIAPYPVGVNQSRVERMLSTIDGVGEVVDVLCRFHLVERHEGSVRMLSPFRFHFLQQAVTMIYIPQDEGADDDYPVVGNEEHHPVVSDEEHYPVSGEEGRPVVREEECHPVVEEEEDHPCYAARGVPSVYTAGPITRKKGSNRPTTGEQAPVRPNHNRTADTVVTGRSDPVNTGDADHNPGRTRPSKRHPFFVMCLNVRAFFDLEISPVDSPPSEPAVIIPPQVPTSTPYQM